jgi:hypothetical protein
MQNQHFLVQFYYKNKGVEEFIENNQIQQFDLYCIRICRLFFYILVTFECFIEFKDSFQEISFKFS